MNVFWDLKNNVMQAEMKISARNFFFGVESMFFADFNLQITKLLNDYITVYLNRKIGGTKKILI